MNWKTYPVSEMPPPAPGGSHPEMPPPRSETPTLVEMVAFFALTAGVLVAVQGLGAAAVLHWHLFGGATLKRLAVNPKFTIPMMAVSYGAVLLIAAALFSRVWQSGFFAGIHWNWLALRRNWMWLPILGVGLGFLIQLASNYFPVPKQIPVDAFFRTPIDAWMVTLFGILIAPAAEEIAFRGFLYPSLRRWTGGIVAALLTSIPFALLHAHQVADAWGPLAMVFVVSLVLVWIREHTGSVAASALVHACYNLSIFAVIFYATGGFQHLERLKE